MEQRRLRLGDIVDDYCPRERRVTNHAVVAMIEEEIKQTRCTTCDTEHAYKGGQAPRRRKKEAPSLYKEVLAGKPPAMPGIEDAPHKTPAAPEAHADADETMTTDDDMPDDAREPVEIATPSNRPALVARAAANQDQDEDEPEAPAAEGDVEASREGDVEDGPVHRPLIRATLPRIEGQKEVRNPPDFTIRQAGGRGNPGNQQFRGGGGAGGGNARMRPRGGNPQSNGHRSPGGHGRFAGGGRPGQGGGQPRGQGGNFRSAQQRHGGGGNRKRSR
jgi:hypothetical protein